MTDIISNDEVVVEQPPTQQTEAAPQATELQAAFWDEKPSALPTQQQEVKQEPAQAEEPKQEPTPTANEWWKSFEFNDEETAKAEIQRLKQVKPQEEIKFENEQSKQVYELLRNGKVKEVMDIYSRQDQLEKVVSSEVNANTADNIIRLQMKLKYPMLNDSQIEFQYNEDYGLPSKPTQKADELDDEYSERVSAWQSQVDRINMKKTVAATMAIPELQKLKSELVLPDISSLSSNNSSQKQPTQEEIAAEKKIREEWARVATSTATQFKGLSTTAKYKDGDKEVELPVSYGLSDEEKRTLSTKLSSFAESGFDPYTILKERWVDANGNDRLDQVVEDLSWLLFGKNAAQKFANEAAHQRLENYLKEKKNIRIDGGGGKDFGQGAEQKTQSQQLQEAFWGS